MKQMALRQANKVNRGSFAVADSPTNKKEKRIMETFEHAIKEVINRYSMENGSNTPDVILAEYLEKCLVLFDETVNKRTYWYNEGNKEPKESEYGDSQKELETANERVAELEALLKRVRPSSQAGTLYGDITKALYVVGEQV